MAHNINFNERTGRYSFFSVQQKAWHGLGQIVEQYPTSEEAIKHAGLDYEVVKSPLFTKGSGIIETAKGIEIGSSELEVPNYFANIRTDNNAVLGVVGNVGAVCGRIPRQDFQRPHLARICVCFGDGALGLYRDLVFGVLRLQPARYGGRLGAFGRNRQ